MKRTKRYIRVFTIMGTAGAVLIILPTIFKFGLWDGIIVTIKASVLWTLIMAIIFIPLDLLLTRKLPLDALHVHQQRELQLKGDPNQIFHECLDILKSYKSIKAVAPLKEKMSISARTKVSLLSFGEDITLKFDVLREGHIRVQMSSRPTFKYALLDYGKNFRNVEWISTAISNHFKAGQKGLGNPAKFSSIRSKGDGSL